MSNPKNNSDFTLWDKFWLIITIIAIAWFVYKLKDNNFNLPAETLFCLTLGIPFMWFMFQYRALRKTKVFISWTIISLLLLGLYFWLRSDTRLILRSGINAANGLKTPIILLATFSGLRQISKNYFYAELIIPPRYSKYDTEEGRNVNAMDVISVIIYFAVIILTNLY